MVDRNQFTKSCTFKRGAWNCGSYQFNLQKNHIDQGDLCDVHYWQTQAQRPWVGLTQTQVTLLREGVHEKSIKTGDSIDWVFYTHINEALKEKNGG